MAKTYEVGSLHRCVSSSKLDGFKYGRTYEYIEPIPDFYGHWLKDTSSLDVIVVRDSDLAKYFIQSSRSLDKPRLNKCTCGADAVSSPFHSEWCDKWPESI